MVIPLAGYWSSIGKMGKAMESVNEDDDVEESWQPAGVAYGVAPPISLRNSPGELLWCPAWNTLNTPLPIEGSGSCGHL